MIRLSAEAEPEIFATTKRFGTVLENVVMDPVTRELDLDDATLAENSRGAYPIDFIPNSSEENMGPLPKNIVMLTADAFGVLPPIARLTPDQAMYHFLSGYTAKVAGTEIGVTEPEATFSTCFGAPFMPRHPSVYGNLLEEADRRGRRSIAGWSTPAGPAANMASASACRSRKRARCSMPRSTAASRMSSSARTRTSASTCRSRFRASTTSILDPRSTWADKDEYDRTAAKLVDLFVENFAEFAEHVEEGVRQAGPQVARRRLIRPVIRSGSLFQKVRSMTEFPVRHFLSDEAVAHIGEGLLARTLPREEWTHEAHLAATTYLLTPASRDRPRRASCRASSRATMRASAG